ncbi:MAG: aminotransferase class V-fold PLP-dependent enzyme [Bacillaceae bacterium]|nr:aminotransferase class V-fold PLP-dependent enzyme [Bacillaceae bacterium]
MDQSRTPLIDALRKHAEKKPLSFHVPGHKNGNVFPEQAKDLYEGLLSIDLTELSGLDDLHQPEGAIKEAQDLAASYYQADHTFFLVGGSTAGNLAMIYSICQPGDFVIVQRNCHKSIMHALELIGARPVFLTPEFNEQTGRYSEITVRQLEDAIQQYPEVKGIVLTYPDYFGHTYPLKNMIEHAHDHGIPVLVDEAHGAHFVLGDPFPTTALALGADMVVQSAHKMLPAMTMSAWLHVRSKFVPVEQVAKYVHMFQSSSPSYPLMASLDLARYYLANLKSDDVHKIIESIEDVRTLFQSVPYWDVIPGKKGIDDPLKLTVRVKPEYQSKEAASFLEQQGIFPEMTADQHILFVFGLKPFTELGKLKLALEQLKLARSLDKHDKIKRKPVVTKPVQALSISFHEMRNRVLEWVPWHQAAGRIAAESVTPYPPGIPFLLKGEQIEKEHIAAIADLIEKQQYIQYAKDHLEKGIYVFAEEG